MQADMHQPSHSQDSRKSSIGCGAVWEEEKNNAVYYSWSWTYK